MKLHKRFRAILAITVIFATALVSAMSAGYTASVAQESLPESCAAQERAPHSAHATGGLCPTESASAQAQADAAGWPDFDPSDMTQEIAQAEAQREAAAWPDFDPTDMTQEIAQAEAQREAAAWPNFDPSDMTQEIAQYEARQAAAAWPNFDSTAISSGASTASQATWDAPFAELAGQVLF